MASGKLLDLHRPRKIEARNGVGGEMFTEIAAKGDQRETLKRSGLYYLLRLRAFQEDRNP